MSRVQNIADPDYVKNQYRDASNINSRIRLHQEFSTNKQGWPRWLFEQFKFTSPCRVLELGCGPGDLWLENLDHIPEGLEIILSDLSAGMLEQAQQNLRHRPSLFRYEVIDAQSILFDDGSFDTVIASMMLYHVPDIGKALSEIKRILKPSGRFYSSTSGCKHLIELKELVSRFDKKLSSWGKLPTGSFSLENGHSQLGNYFSSVSLSRYPDSLIVTDANLLTEYILSGRIELPIGKHTQLRKFVTQELETNGGKLNITKDVGLFESKGILQQ